MSIIIQNVENFNSLQEHLGNGHVNFFFGGLDKMSNSNLLWSIMTTKLTLYPLSALYFVK